MSKNSEGSLGYQMMKALQGIFQPGTSRYKAKRYHRDAELITGISTMRCWSADVHQFARFIRFNWPQVKPTIPAHWLIIRMDFPDLTGFYQSVSHVKITLAAVFVLVSWRERICPQYYVFRCWVISA